MLKTTKLPRKVAKDIDYLRRQNASNAFIFGNAVKGELNSSYTALKEFAVKRPEGLWNALVNGYEVEATVEEKFEDFYYNLNSKQRELVREAFNIVAEHPYCTDVGELLPKEENK